MIIIVVLLAAAIYFITVDDAIFKEAAWENTNYAASQYINNVSIDSDGNTIWVDKPESGGGVGSLSDLPYSNPAYPNITNAQQAFDELLYTAPSINSFTSDCFKELITLL